VLRRVVSVEWAKMEDVAVRFGVFVWWVEGGRKLDWREGDILAFCGGMFKGVSTLDIDISGCFGIEVLLSVDC
jgi:hypothetical protein